MDILDFIKISTIILLIFLLLYSCNLKNIKKNKLNQRNCEKENFSIDTSCRSLPVLCPPGTVCPQGSIVPVPQPVISVPRPAVTQPAVTQPAVTQPAVTQPVISVPRPKK